MTTPEDSDCEGDDLDDDAPFKCWCGEEGPFDEMCDSEVFNQTCGGTGTLHCECGGDFCVCHNHGEVECPGCEDCEPDDDWDDDDWDDDWDDDNVIDTRDNYPELE